MKSLSSLIFQGHKARGIAFGILCLWMALAGQVGAQTPNYSQFHQTPLLTNPAMGAMSSHATAAFGYRNFSYGGATGLATPTLSLTYPFFAKTRRDTIRTSYAGLLLMSDRQGNGGILATSGGALSYAYNLRLGYEDRIALGLQLGLFQRRIDLGAYRSGNQFNNFTGTFDPNLPLNEATNTSLVTYPLVNGGLMYFREDFYGKVKHYLGFSGFNLNSPNISFFTNSDERLPLNFNLHGGFLAYTKGNIEVVPNFRAFFQTTKVNQVNVGSLVQYRFNNLEQKATWNGTVGVGVWYNLNGAAVASLEANLRDFFVGVAYDYVTSDLNSSLAQARSAEIIVGWRKLLGPVRVKPKPKERPLPKPALPPVKKDTVAPKPVVKDTTAPKPAVVDTTKPADPAKPVIEPTAEPATPEVDETGAPIKDKAVKPGKATKPAKGTKASKPVRGGKKGAAAKPGKPGRPVKGAKPVRGQTGGTEEEPEADDLGSEGGDEEFGGYALNPAEKKVMRSKPNFAFNSVELSPGDKRLLDELAEVMKGHPGMRVELQGHTCDIGSEEVNQRMSESRAKSALDYMTAKGMDASLFEVKGYGEQAPLVPNTSAGNRAKNRRVAFRVLPKTN